MRAPVGEDLEQGRRVRDDQVQAEMDSDSIGAEATEPHVEEWPSVRREDLVRHLFPHDLDRALFDRQSVRRHLR